MGRVPITCRLKMARKFSRRANLSALLKLDRKMPESRGDNKWLSFQVHSTGHFKGNIFHPVCPIGNTWALCEIEVPCLYISDMVLKEVLFFQFNVQRLQDAHTLSSQAAASSVASSAATAASVGAGGILGDTHPLAAHHHPLYLQGSAHSSGGSVSSTGGGSPTSPLRPGKEEECSLHGRSSTEG